MVFETKLTPHQQAAINHSRHISLTANAGSGKTFILSKRYLEIALNENIPLRNIAAITFTDKAASELYTKIVKQIEEMTGTEGDLTVLRRLEQIRRQLVSASISTIHSFCIDILREYPVEASLDANFSAIDERESDELIEICVEELIKNSLTNENSDKLKYLIRVFGSKSIFIRELTSLIKCRKNVTHLVDILYNKSEPEIAEAFYQSFLFLLDKLIIQNLPGFHLALTEINNNVLSDDNKNEVALETKVLLTRIDSEKRIELKLNLIRHLSEVVATKSFSLKKRGYLSGKRAEGLEHQINIADSFLKASSKFRIAEDHYETELELAKFGKTIIYFFEKALELYSSKKNENGFLDFEDILLLTQKILEFESVRLSLGEKFKYIMVDEYQDTNELQYNIFLPILDHLKIGNLFVVGDEKQSIYRFRDAELEVFNRTKKDIKKTSGEKYLLSLPDSFRMTPAICLFVNYIFKKLFAEPDEFFNEVKHSDLVCAREREPSGKVEILISEKTPKNIQSASLNEVGVQINQNNECEEAELIAKKILLLVNDSSSIKKIMCSDIAILVKKRKHFTDLERIFVKYKIPFVIVGGKGFYQRQVIYDIYNYFSFLLNQNNDAALLGVLRSPFFLVPDTQIFEISLVKGESLWDKIIRYSTGNDKIVPVLEKLKENILFSRSYDLTAMLRKILIDSEFLPVVNSAPAGEQELANLDKLVKLTMAFVSKGFNTLYDYVDFLGESLDSIEDESQAALTDDSTSVKIMTVHQAKGLEFPVVILYKCEEAPLRDTVKAKSITINKEFGLLTKVPLRENYSGEYNAAPLLALTDLVNRKKESAELKRLFYVGATRAKDHLILSCTSDDEYDFPEDSFMRMLIDGLDKDITGDSIKIMSDLIFLNKTDEGYLNESTKLNIEIPITRKIEQVIPLQKLSSAVDKKLVFDIGEISDLPEGEIISATKYSIFSQCQVKYELIYETGFSEIAGRYNSWQKKKNLNISDKLLWDLNTNEDLMQAKDEDGKNKVMINSSAAVRGKIIHRFLQMELGLDKLDSFVETELTFENIQIGPEKIDLPAAGVIKSDLKKYLVSDTYNKLKSYTNFQNEYEVYVKENDFYLYGIIDKLIIEKDSARIVDYKTNDISIEEIVPKSKDYLNQLKFYSYIVSRLFKQVSEISIQLVFIKHPDQEVIIKIDSDGIKRIKEEIEDFVNISRRGIYEKNPEHCSSCNFSLTNGGCVKS